MATSKASLEEMYSRLSLEEEEDGGIEVAEGDIKARTTFVLVGSFLTERNINFNAMKNVMAALWRPREGMDVLDLGEQRYSFVFYHILDMQKVLDGGPWTFEQNLLVYHWLKEGEVPHSVPLNTIDIWIQVYDLPAGLISENVFKSIGQYVGEFIKSDPANINGGWKLYSRIRVKIDLRKPIKRRMKVKRAGGEWSWANFKYERLSSFCFVCGLLGHQERDCAIVYANPDKEITRAYGTWLRAPGKNDKRMDVGAKWLRSDGDGRKKWEEGTSGNRDETTVQGSGMMQARFMEVDGVVSEIQGENGAITVTPKNQEINVDDNNISNQLEENEEGDKVENTTVIIDPKRRRMELDMGVTYSGPGEIDGPKNLREAGPGMQARLNQ